ncbi:hypothetical protein N7509_004567 [Penicillium cosmopolitanum]|uniref:OPT family small oligopeptide transporter n=1 Tax=Penicillium cosmopolitanum TaxID=1131564 RepID=A0A9X0B9B0_9EURO|nr:uncharacterized protein N7509_004567 [Penicillium cosmopolitanum]KAJ5396454.1 hypothetical protein N7509_004567 [Penicillium cosmopolitanum]
MMHPSVPEIDGISPSQSEELTRHEKIATDNIKELQKFELSHQWDPNLPQEKLDAIKEAVENGDHEKAVELDKSLAQDSQYESVRAAVRNTDNGEVANTVRAWVLGLLFTTVGSGLNMFLSMRSPAISFPAIVVQLLVYPMGCFWARVMPTKVFNTFGLRWTLNTGPFTIKEHTVITVMANVSIGYAYCTDALLALKAKPFYNMEIGWGFQLLFALSSQVVGIALAGIFRRFLVWPAAMIWPGQFANTALFHALHDKRPSNPSETDGWSISRYRYFIYVMAAAFLWYWIPGVLWQGLSVFAFVTWIRPNNVVLNQLFGGFSGLSLIPITFDWTYVSAYLLDPLLAPAHAIVNTLIGLTVFIILATIGISYTGAFYSAYLPINTSSTFDNTQQSYNVTKILGESFSFDEQKYKAYSPMFLAPTFALNYGLSFAALTAAVVHIILFHRKEIWHRFTAAREQEPDIHLILMKKYQEVPEWWYAALGAVSIALGLAGILAYDSQLPWWGLFVSIIIAAVFIVPTCMILAITNIQLSLNVISPFLAGFMIPGKPIGVMVFKVFSTITLGQAQVFCQDLKIAHYMKIPPRVTFMCQAVAAVWACFVQIAVMNWTLGNIENVCASDQSAHFTCPNGRAFFSNSITWGALLPVAFYILMRVFPRSKARLLNAPVMLGAMSWIPPATPLSYFSWAMFGLIFNYWIHRRWRGWWHTYNYITAAGLDTGLILSTIVIFFAITFPGVTLPNWWGNTAPFETMDALFTAVRKTVSEGEIFGPAKW